MDTGTGLTILAPSALMLKVLGPTAEYMGSGIQLWTERRVHNINNVFTKAADKLGAERLQQPGSVPPKVLKGILDEAQFCDDELTAEYLGGVLASARTDTSRDDRAASLLSLVARLSAYQLRAHYVMYSAARQSLLESDFNLGDAKLRRKRGTFFFPGPAWQQAMDFTEQELKRNQFQSIVDHVFYGLGREDLIDPGVGGTGSASYLSKMLEKEAPQNGMVFCVSMLGVELFTAAHGITGRPAEKFLKKSHQFDIESPLVLGQDVSPVSDLPGLQTDS